MDEIYSQRRGDSRFDGRLSSESVDKYQNAKELNHGIDNETETSRDGWKEPSEIQVVVHNYLKKLSSFCKRFELKVLQTLIM